MDVCQKLFPFGQQQKHYEIQEEQQKHEFNKEKQKSLKRIRMKKKKVVGNKMAFKTTLTLCYMFI